MDRLRAPRGGRERVVLFVPRWLEASASPSGLPYRVVPVLSSLLANGFDVDFFTEVHDGWRSPAIVDSVRGSSAAVAWSAELNPGVQIPSLLGFFEQVLTHAPDVRRIAGGGFFPLVPPPRLDLAPLVGEVVTGEEVDALSRHLLGRVAGAAPGHREAFSVSALRQIELRPFLRPEAMLFGNDRPALQVPTASGCGKRCSFCFYERTSWRVLAADAVVDAITDAHARCGVDQFLFGELDFLASSRRALAVARGLIDRRVGVDWFALASVPDVVALAPGELRTLRRSGCVALELGLEAGSDAALQKLGKRATVADGLRAHAALLAAGIRPVYNFVFGWPGETRADRDATCRLVDRLARSTAAIRFNFRIYEAIPLTTMGEPLLSQLPRLPRDLDEVRSYRVDDRRKLPWLSPGDERQVRFLVEYVLPLGYDDALGGKVRTPTRRALSRVARWRSRTGFLRMPWDRSLFRRVASVGLPSTYLP